MKITIPQRRLTIATLLVILTISAILAFLLFSNKGYPATSKWKTYSNSKLSFSYPSSWKFQPCNPKEGREITLPGTIDGTFETDHEPLIILGSFSGRCNESGLNPKIYTVKEISQSQECSVNRGDRLKNGLYMEVHGLDEFDVTSIYVYQDRCATEYGDDIIDFDIYDEDNSVSAENILKYGGEPRVEKVDFLASQQYKDIKKFAESIVLK
ncbi:MAG TPA: hypothetical protein VF809_00675 [Candidatus Saccharimonadales bacterium]